MMQTGIALHRGDTYVIDRSIRQILSTFVCDLPIYTILCIRLNRINYVTDCYIDNLFIEALSGRCNEASFLHDIQIKG